ncbi:MAG TPA: YHS domain-containing protein [Bryobacteraceae bacterium]|nr:YHS domain-containing protein [Bryobacteraceae bacterium]
MFRVIFYLLLTVVAISVLKSIIGIFLRGVSEAMKPGSASPGTAGAPRSANQVPLTGELKKDPVCGTYIATATSIKEKVGGQTFHFCSQECRDKYVATMAR